MIGSGKEGDLSTKLVRRINARKYKATTCFTQCHFSSYLYVHFTENWISNSINSVCNLTQAPPTTSELPLTTSRLLKDHYRVHQYTC